MQSPHALIPHGMGSISSTVVHSTRAHTHANTRAQLALFCTLYTHPPHVCVRLSRQTRHARTAHALAPLSLLTASTPHHTQPSYPHHSRHILMRTLRVASVAPLMLDILLDGPSDHPASATVMPRLCASYPTDAPQGEGCGAGVGRAGAVTTAAHVTATVRDW